MVSKVCWIVPEVQFQARLQIARRSREDPARALEFIVSIIESERCRPGTVPMSVLLEAFVGLRLRFLDDAARAAETKYREYMAHQIKTAACCGDNQPIRTFAAVGADWSFTAKTVFIDVLRQIDVGRPEDAEEDVDRVAIGRLLAAAGKMYSREGRESEARKWLEDAVAFYAAIRRPDGFTIPQYADALIQLDRVQDAEDLLEAVQQGERNPFWRLRRSAVHRAKHEHTKALECLDLALDEGGLGRQEATFLESRGDLLFDLQEPTFADWFRKAIAASDTERNRERLLGRLEALEGEALRW